MRIVALCNNEVAAGPGLVAEHGLSLYIEWRGLRLLFDTGQTGAVVHNARFLGIDLSAIDAVILSHGHYDHTGGLMAVLAERRGKATPVYGHPGMFTPRYARRSHKLVYAGIQWRRADAASKGALFDCATASRELWPDVWLTGEIPRITGCETGDPALVLRRPEGETPDPVPDDQALVLALPAGLVVVVGCAHAGLINTIRAAQQLVPGKPVQAVVGGSHLGSAAAEQVDATLDFLEGADIPVLRLMHCTGDAVKQLYRRHPGSFAAFPVGRELQLE